MEYIATFYTHSGAIKYRRHLRGKKIDVELMPVPRELSSNCGIAASFTLTQDINSYISDDMEKLFKITTNGYQLLYENT